MLLARSTRWTLTLVSGLVLAGGVPFWQPRGQADEPPKTTAAQGRLQGRFTSADTGKPVVGAKVIVGIDGVPGKPKRAEAISDADGRYSLEVPIGHLHLWGVHAPASYYTQDPETFGTAVTTAAEPRAVRDFVLQQGAPWQAEVIGATVNAANPPHFSAYPNPDPNPESEWFALGEVISVGCDASGKAVLTVPTAVGRFRVSCNPMLNPSTYEIPSATLEMDKDFDPRKIKGAPEPHLERRGAVRLRDAASRSAVVEGVDVLVEDGQAVLRFPAEKVPAAESLVLRGAAVDEAGKPIEGVKFTAAFYIGRSAAMSQLEATTDANGKFELREVLLPQSWFQPGSRIRMLAAKSGFHATQTTKLNLLEVKQAGKGDFGTVVLKSGSTLRGKVVDEEDRPLQGAVVKNMTDYFLYSHLECRTDAKGEFVMPDLTFGPQLISATYGEQSGVGNYAFNATSGECVITVRPHPKPVGGPPGRPAPLPPVPRR